jgi:DnaJ-class molecular chaperone
VTPRQYCHTCGNTGRVWVRWGALQHWFIAVCTSCGGTGDSATDYRSRALEWLKELRGDRQ